VKLTRDGCCPLPQWLADGSGVYFYSYGLGDVGMPQRATWQVPREGGPPRLLSPFYGAFSADRRLVAYPDGRLTRIAQLYGPPVGVVDSDGWRVYFAPQGDRVAWLAPAPDAPPLHPALEPPSRVAVARVDGGDVRVLPPVVHTETLQWFPDGRQILCSGREAGGAHPGLLVLDTATGGLTHLVDGPFLEHPLVAPDGRHVVYTATLQGRPEDNGVWLVDVEGGQRRRLPITGGYRWTPDGQALLYVPAPSGQPTDELWRYRLADEARTPLVDAARVHFAIAQDDWEVSPDGRAIVYRSATDGAIWVLDFGP
jgi:hypothetical protein